MKLYSIRGDRGGAFGDSVELTTVLPPVKVGLEVEVEWSPRASHDLIQAATAKVLNSQYWHSHQDGSLRNGVEFSFAIPLQGQAVEEAVRSLCAALADCGRSTIRTGIHIHVNMREETDTHETLLAYVKLFMLIEDAMFTWVGAFRKGLGYCEPISEGAMPVLDSLLAAGTSENELLNILTSPLHRYYSLNLAALVKYGTVEFRMFPTLYDPEQILKWVKVVTALKLRAKQLQGSLQEHLEKAQATLSPVGMLEDLLGPAVYDEIRDHLSITTVGAVLRRVVALGIESPKISTPVDALPLLTPKQVRTAKTSIKSTALLKFMKTRQKESQ